MLYLTLLTPILALPGLLLMDRVERWAAGDHPQAFRVPRSVPTADSATCPTRPLAQREQEQLAVVIGLHHAAESVRTQNRTRTDRDWRCDHEPPRRSTTSATPRWHVLVLLR